MTASTSAKSEDFLHVSVKGKEGTKLAAYAGRIATLLSDPLIVADVAAVSTLDYFSGAIHALLLVRHQGYRDRPNRSPKTRPIQKIAEYLRQGRLRRDGPWLAGFNFNNGLARLVAVYERSMKLAGAQRADHQKKQDVEREAEKLYRKWAGRQWAHTSIERVYLEVNRLKHAASGEQRREVQFAECLIATEEILELLETWKNQGCPR